MHTGRTLIVMWAAGFLLVGAARAAEAKKEPASRPVVFGVSAEVQEKLERAKGLAREQKWQEAGELYYEVSEKHGEALAPAKLDEAGQPILYRPAIAVVDEHLSLGPEKSRQAWLDKADGLAEKAWKDAPSNNRQAVAGVYRRYFHTAAGRNAGLRLIELAEEAHDDAGMMRVADRLLKLHQGLSERNRVVLLYRLGAAAHRAGDRARAVECLRELGAKHANAKETIDGKDVDVFAALAEVLMTLPAPKLEGLVPKDTWPTFGGSIAGGGASEAEARPPYRLLYSEPLLWRDPGLHAEPWSTQEKTGQTRTIMPAVYAGNLYFHDGHRVWALELATGKPVKEWTATYPGNVGGSRYVMPDATPPADAKDSWTRQAQHTLTVTNSALLAVMGVNRTGYRDEKANKEVNRPPGTRLVCLNRADGAERWRVGPPPLPELEPGAWLEEFSGVPRVIEDSVLVIVRWKTEFLVEACGVACYDIANGKVRWFTRVASAYVGPPDPKSGWYFPDQSYPTLSHLACAEGHVYFSTESGFVASLDDQTGRVDWLTAYERQTEHLWAEVPFAWKRQEHSSIKPWEPNSVIADGQVVFVLPADGMHLTFHDAVSGELLKRVPVDLERNGEVKRFTMLTTGQRLLLGLRHVGSSTDALLSIQWKSYDPKGADGQKLDVNATFWLIALNRITDRAFVTQRHVLVATENAWVAANLSRGKVEYRYPHAGADWPANEGTGNLVLVDGYLIIATGNAVNVYADKTHIPAQ